MSGACSIDYYFSPPQKRLMRPENSTRKVNTILKCQEINDIVLSSYGPVGKGDKCLALFTPFLPICDLLLSLSNSLCLCVCFSFILHLPFSPTLSLPRSPPLTMVSRCPGLIPITAFKCCSYMQWHNTGDGLCCTLCAVVSKWIALIHLHLEAVRFQCLFAFCQE